jgi:acetylornithine/N-succinyldiaminopimelate aminotransferase
MEGATGEISEVRLMNTYGARELVIVRGQGVRLYDSAGREYLDFLGGLGVNNLGHCHPEIVEALQRQSERLIHCCNLYLIEPQVQLAELLCANSFADRAFFCNSGAEANEAALKLCRLWAHQQGRTEQKGFIAFDCSFHGRTMGAMAVSGPERVREGFEPPVPGVRFARFNDLAHVDEFCDENICAIIVEPVIGEGGVIPAEREFLHGVRQLCDERGLALIFDEIQCGLGRIGTNFAYEHYGVTPDIITLAKGLAGGAPIGAMLARGEFAEVFQPGKHGSTFGGNPLSSAAAVAYCRELFEHGLAERARETGAYLRRLLEEAVSGCKCVKEVRGLGLMLGIALDREGAAVVQRAQELGLLINCTAQTVIRLLPPLIVTEEDCAQAVKILSQCLHELDK